MKIKINGPIIPSNDQWIYDWFDIEATSPKKVQSLLDQAAMNEEIILEINSGGGSVWDASEIYTMLKEYEGKVTGKIMSLAASAASAIAMASDHLMMAPTAQMMIHNASMRAEGDHRDMNHASEFLKGTNQTIANAYQIKSGKSYDELLSMMDAETWLTPQQAMEHNLIDEIMFQSQPISVVANADGGMIPPEVIEKVRNELKKGNLPDSHTTGSQPQNIIQEPITNTKEEQGMDLEKLKNDHPDLYKQIKDEGYQEGIQAENQRIKDIEDLALPGNDDLINKAKFESMNSANDVAMQIIKAEKQRGQTYLTNRQDDATIVNTVPGSSTPEASGKTGEAKQSEVGKNIANMINKMRGVN